MPLLVDNDKFFYFRLKTEYIEPVNSSHFYSDYRSKNTLFWLRKRTMTKEKLAGFLKGESIYLHLEDNYYSTNFKSEFFEIVDREGAEEYLKGMKGLGKDDNEISIPF